MDMHDELLGLVRAFAEAGVDYALCGGIAVAIHGYARFTKDIDFLVRQEDMPQITETVGRLGFGLAAGPIPFDIGGPWQREIHRLSKIADGDVLTLDFLLVPEFLEDVWRERDIYEWRGRSVQVVSLDGLVKMKRIAGRDQDLLDLKQLGYPEE